MDIQRLEVGKLFESGKTRYTEGIKFEFTSSGPVLLIYFESPTDKEINSISKGKFRIGFYDIENIIFMLAKFEDISWMDAPYNIHLSQPFSFSEQLEQEDLGFGLQIFLIDAATGILKAIRLVGLGHKFSIKLRDTILKQKEMPFDNQSYIAKLNDLYKRYTPDQLSQYSTQFYTTN